MAFREGAQKSYPGIQSSLPATLLGASAVIQRHQFLQDLCSSARSFFDYLDPLAERTRPQVRSQWAPQAQVSNLLGSLAADKIFSPDRQGRNPTLPFVFSSCAYRPIRRTIKVQLRQGRLQLHPLLSQQQCRTAFSEPKHRLLQKLVLK